MERSMQRYRLAFSSLLALLLAGSQAAAADVRAEPAQLRDSMLRGQQLADGQSPRQSDAADRRKLTLTVYQDGSALVHDRREVSLGAGANRLSLLDVSPGLLPQSLRIGGEGSPRVHAQRYEQALLTRDALLQAHVGHGVELRRDLDGEELSVQARLLSIAGGVPVVSITGDGDERVELLDPQSPWRIAFRDINDELRSEPGLVLDLETGLGGRQHLDLLYLSTGLTWQADYVLTVSQDSLDITAWASIDNSTGIALDNAHLRLVAGDLNRGGGGGVMAMGRSMAKEDGMRSQAAGDYQLFNLPQPMDLARDERTQLPLFQAKDVPMIRDYRLESHVWGRIGGEQSLPVSVHLRFDNEGDALARAMPAGAARVYQYDDEGEALYLGEDHLPATPAGNPVDLKVGNAFNITALRSQTDFRRLDERSEQQSWRIRLANAGDTPVTLEVIEIFSGDWTILDASAPHGRVAADRAGWDVEVPANGSAELNYRVEVRR